MDEIDEAKRNIIIKGVINMIQDINILYHGTGATFENPDLDNSREDVDFGVGFYTTQNKEMAKKWASSKRKSTINTYSFNRISDLKIYTFKLDEEWLDFVINNRLGIDSQKNMINMIF